MKEKGETGVRKRREHERGKRTGLAGEERREIAGGDVRGEANDSNAAR